MRVRRALDARPDAAETERWTALLDAARDWLPVELPVKGRDLVDMGVPHGPRIGGLLAAAETWWEELDYRPDRAQCLDKLRELVAGGL